MFLGVLKVLFQYKPPIKIIHCHSIHYAIGTIVLSKILRVPAVLSIGGTDIRRAARLPPYLKLISSFDAVVYVAKSHRQLLLKNMPNAKSCTYPTGWIKIFFQ